jgi:hypothetical protein
MRARWLTGVAAVGVVIAVAVPVGLSRKSHRAVAPSGPAATASSKSTTVTGSLPGGRWTSLPPGPLAARSDAVGVWTGSTMLVWGGAAPSGNTEYADGAAYSPSTHRWQKLPTSPLSARIDMASVWTGKQLFIWGGGGPDVGNDHDGALYNPSTHRWTRLPSPPVSDFSTVHAYWTGSRVLLLSVPSGHQADHLVLQAFDPRANRWTLLPALKLAPEHDGIFAEGVVAASRFYLWSEWAHTSSAGRNATSTRTGIDGYTFDLDRGRWATDPLASKAHDTVVDPIWTGRDILLPASSVWCGVCPGPFTLTSTGSQLVPATGRTRVIAHGPADDLSAQYLWTGSVLLAVNTGAYLGGGRHATYPGVAAYWSPSTRRWTTLPHAPMAGSDATVVWTGRSVIIWGALARARDVNPTTHIAAAGIQLAH